VKEFLSRKGVGYTEKNVAADTVARDEMFRQTGRMAVPALTIDDQVVVGFDKQRLEQLLV
jgi:glutaredoxin